MNLIFEKVFTADDTKDKHRNLELLTSPFKSVACH